MPVFPNPVRRIVLCALLLAGWPLALSAQSPAGDDPLRQDVLGATMAGEYALQAGRLEEASRWYLDAARASGDDAGLAERATRIALLGQDDRLAAQALALWRARAPATLPMRAAEATLALRSGKQRVAERELKALMRDPDPAGWRHALQVLATGSRDPAVSGRRMQRLFDANVVPDELPAWVGFGDRAQRLDQDALASRVVDRIVQRFPGDPRVALLRAGQLRENGDLDGARAVLAEVAGAAAIAPELRLAMAAEYDALGDPAAAEQVLAKGPQDLRIQALLMQSRMAVSPLRGLLGPRVGLIAHQLYIAHEVGRRLAPRVLLADEVGLGKTIEAGLIIHQQLTTGRAERVLVLVPDSLQYQWMIEMRRRFNLHFSLYDLERTASIREHDEDANPFLAEQCIIASIDLLLDHEDLREQALAAGFDLLVVDEAHHLIWSEDEDGSGEGHGNDRYELVAGFAAQTAGVLLLTATPEQLGVESHFARLRLLDPERFQSLEDFLDEEARYAETAEVASELLNDAPLTPEHHQALEKLLGHPIEDEPQARYRVQVVFADQIVQLPQAWQAAPIELSGAQLAAGVLRAPVMFTDQVLVVEARRVRAGKSTRTRTSTS